MFSFLLLKLYNVFVDVVAMREGLKLARKIAGTAPLNSVVGDEITPGSTVASDNDWDAWLKNNGGTEFHPTSSCAMLPREQGGVVDNKLKVYGISNVRIVDASVFPINFAAHVSFRFFVNRSLTCCVFLFWRPWLQFLDLRKGPLRLFRRIMLLLLRLRRAVRMPARTSHLLQVRIRIS
jgi:hypothetical protein